MGFFSWKCAECGESIYNKYSDKAERNPELAHAVLVTPDERHVEPAYDGYGVFAAVDVYTWCGDGNRDLGIDRDISGPCPPNREIKVLHAKCDHGQAYADLPRSENCPNQGYWEWA